MAALAPGLVLVATVAVSAAVLGARTPVPTLLTAMLLGAVVAHLPRRLGVRIGPGLRFSGRHLLRVGVVLLGLRMSIGDVGSLGVIRVASLLGLVTAAMFVTRWFGGVLGVSPILSLLVATGFSVCGASAIAAVAGTVDAEEDDVAVAIGLVALYGTVATVMVPYVAALVGLTDAQLGMWAGSSIHDVGQVVAAASVSGVLAVKSAVLVKLVRVCSLAPLVAVLAVRSNPLPTKDRPRRILIPWFVLAFLCAAALRSSGVVATTALDAARTLEQLFLGMGMVGLGSGLRLTVIRKLRPSVLLLGFGSWVFIGSVSLALVVLAW